MNEYTDADFLEIKLPVEPTPQLPVEKPTEPIPVEPTKIKPLPFEKPEKKKSSKLKMVSMFFIGLILGIILLSASISYGIVNNYVPLEKCNEYNTMNYNNGAAFIINYTKTTGNLPYFDNGELKELKCIGGFQ